MRNYINILVFSESNSISSAVDLRIVLGNFCAEILKLNSLTNMLQERHSVNLIPKKFKNLLAEKRRHEPFFNTTAITYNVLFLNSFFADMPSFYGTWCSQ